MSVDPVVSPADTPAVPDRNPYERVTDARDQTIGSMYIGILTTIDRVYDADESGQDADEAVIAEAFSQAVAAAKRVIAPHPHLRIESDV